MEQYHNLWFDVGSSLYCSISLIKVTFYYIYEKKMFILLYLKIVFDICIFPWKYIMIYFFFFVN